jgi:uncharacterized protein YdaU (DUF1376 family)
MSKKKDPAFLFYPKDWITGTAFLTKTQKGIYIDLLCLQHQKGYITKNFLYQTCDGVEEDIEAILEFFHEDDKGNYYNRVLKSEIERRKANAEKNSQNSYKRWKKDAEKDANADAKQMHSAVGTETETGTVLNSIESIEDPTPDPLADLYED